MNVATTALLGLGVGWLGMWVLGAARKSAHRSVWRMGNAVVGVLGVWAAITYLWEHRRAAASVVAALVLAGSLLFVAGVWWLLPAQRASIILPALLAVLVALYVIDQRKTGNVPLRQWLRDVAARERVRESVHATHPNARVLDVHAVGDGWRVGVDHVGDFDPELVGQRLNVAAARSTPTRQLGRSTLLLEDRAGGWARFDGVRLWERARVRRAGDRLTFAYGMDGAPVSIPWPGQDGSHLLVAGATGAGKSALLRVLLAEMAHAPDALLVMLDPKRVEFRAWRARGHVILGDEACGRAFEAVVAEMHRRYELVASGDEDDVEWTTEHGPRIVLVVDELSALTTYGEKKVVDRRKADLQLILAMGRAAGIGVVLCTQRPSRDVIPLDLRDNCRVRIGLGMESPQGTEMVMGDSKDKAPCHAIPEALKGACFVRIDRTPVMARSEFLDPTRVRQIADATSTWKGEAGWLEA